jgi:hypothetical protein
MSAAFRKRLQYLSPQEFGLRSSGLPAGTIGVGEEGVAAFGDTDSLSPLEAFIANLSPVMFYSFSNSVDNAENMPPVVLMSGGGGRFNRFAAIAAPPDDSAESTARVSIPTASFF